MASLLEKYKKVAGTGPGSTIGLADWNGLLEELSGTLAGLIKKGADFDAVANVAIGVLLDRINDVLTPAYDQVTLRGQQIETLYASISGTGISADSVIDSPNRYMLTDARRAAILSDIRGNVAAEGDTLAELYALVLNRVRYDTTQGLSVTQKVQAKRNIGAMGTGVPIYAGATTLDASHAGQLVYFYNGGYTITLPPLSALVEGEAIEFQNNGNISSTPVLIDMAAADKAANKYMYRDGTSSQGVPLYPGESIKIQRYPDGWFAYHHAPSVTAALLSDRVQSFSAAQQAQLASNLGLVMPAAMQCRLVATDGLTIQLQPFTGTNVFINGKIRQISAGLGPTLTIAGAGLNSGTLYYIYAYWTGTAVALVATVAAPVRDGTYGIYICTGDPTASLVGMVVPFVNAGAGNAVQFGDNDQFRYVASYYHRQRKSLFLEQMSGSTGSAITEFGNRTYFLSWGEDASDLGLYGYCYTPTYDNQIWYGAVDGVALHSQFSQTQASNNSSPIAETVSRTFARGAHYHQIYARSGGSTLYLNHIKTGAVVL